MIKTQVVQKRIMTKLMVESASGFKYKFTGPGVRGRTAFVNVPMMVARQKDPSEIFLEFSGEKKNRFLCRLSTFKTFFK